MDRRAPRWDELKPLLRVAPRARSHDERAVARVADIEGLRRLARRRAPKSVFDYVEGGAGDELAVRYAIEAFDRVEFMPRVLVDVSSIDTSTTILGGPSTLPFVFSPTGFTRMMHTAGETAVGRVARDIGIPYGLSTVGTTTPEDLAAALGPLGRRWFQLYVWKDRERSAVLLERARSAGFEALVLTVDVPISGDRRRDVRNGMTIPPTLNWKTFLDGALHPRWLADFLTTDPVTFATLQESPAMSLEGMATAMFDESVAWSDIAWFREHWDGPMVLKGIQSVSDAARAAAEGMDAIVISNHGGRQLDRASTPLDMLVPVVDAVGDRIEVFMDGGVRSGADVVAAVALGAKAVLVGRAYLYGLTAAGEVGVHKAAQLLADDVRRTMGLLGVTSVDQLSRDLVRLHPR